MNVLYYRFDPQGRRRGPGKIGNQWIKCQSSIAGSSTGSGGWKCSSTAHISCLVESGEIDKVGNTKRAIAELVYNCPAHKDD